MSCSRPRCLGHSAQTHEEVTCARCTGVRWVQSPYLELDERGHRTPSPPVDLLADGYTCQRCRAVLAGRPVADPRVTPEARERLTAARQRQPAGVLHGKQPRKGA